MTSVIAEVLPPEFPEPERHDSYLHVRFTEAEAPALAEAAWRAHAEGYQTAGFLTEEAIDETTGWLPEDIDKSRGPNTDYSLAYSTDTGNVAATMRLINVDPEGTYQDLPAYRLCANNLTPAGKELLGGYDREGYHIKEVAALAGSHPGAVFETIRDNMHRAIGNNEIWFFSIVSSTHTSLARQWGAENLAVLGEDTPLDDPRVTPDLKLRPAVLVPDEFNDRLLDAYDKSRAQFEESGAPRDQVQMMRLQRSFMFFTEGLDETKLSLRCALARQAVIAERIGSAVVEAN